MAAPLLSSMLVAATIGWGQSPVARVTLIGPGARDVGELARIFGVSQGSILSRAEIREGVQALMATGEVEDVTVDVEQLDAGTALTVQVQVASRISSVRVEGLDRAQKNAVLAALGLRVGSPLQVSAFEVALERARDQLREGGYPGATIEPDLVFDAQSGQVSVALKCNLGSPVRLASVAVRGADESPRRLLELIGLSRGDLLSSSALEAARRRLAGGLRRDGFWEAEVDQPVIDKTDTGAAVTFIVACGPHYRLELAGLDRDRTLESEALPFLVGDEAFTSVVLDGMAAAVRAALQRRGYMLANADASLRDETDGRVLVLKVRRGTKTPIRAVHFPGADGIDTKLLREKIGARPGRPWRWGREPVDETTLAADASSLLAVVRAEGFADGRVEAARIVPARGGVAIEFPIVTGARRTVSELTVTGVPSAVQLKPLGLAVGAPWSQEAEDRDAEGVRDALLEAGYLDATVTPSHRCLGETCAVTMTATPGLPTVVGRIVIAGLVRVNRGVVDKVAGLRVGEPAGPARRLQAERQLLGLGVFSAASVRTLPGQGSGPRRSLVIGVEEAPSRAFGFGLGYDTWEKARLSLSWSELNLFGSGRSLYAESRVSSKELRFQFTYREPASLALLGTPLWASVYRTEERAETYSLLRRGMWVELGDRMRRPVRGLLRYDYQVVDPTAPPDILSQLERDKQRVRIASLTPTLEWDTRDDMFSPHRGVLASLSWQSAFKVFVADTAFDKINVSLAGFVPAAGGVLAASLRGGGIWPRNAPEPALTDPIDVPIAIRYFAGGRISHRAFPTDKLGIPGQTLDAAGHPKGGGALVLGNFEWRFPVYGPIGASVFVDGGNVWREPRDVNLGQVRWGAGLGLRVETPVGPLRLEYGWKLKREWISPTLRESGGELFLAFGNPF